VRIALVAASPHPHMSYFSRTVARPMLPQMTTYKTAVRRYQAHVQSGSAWGGVQLP
jgi:hypothetical protein